MNLKRLSVVTGFVVAWTGSCLAAPSGIIQFHGSIVEAACNTGTPGGATVEFNECPQALRGGQFEVQSVRSVMVPGNAPVNIKLVTESGSGRYYDQRYVLVDAHDKPIQSGAYIVTMTAP